VNETLFDPEAISPEPSAHRVEALAGLLAGFRWPGRNSFDQLKKSQKAAALDAANEALMRLQSEPD
jgi:hypothetical protein